MNFIFNKLVGCQIDDISRTNLPSVYSDCWFVRQGEVL